MSFMDEIRFFQIHPMDYDKLSPTTKAQIIAFEDWWYTGGLKNGEPFDKVAEAKRLTESLVEIRKSPGQTNHEGMVVDQLIELLRRMDLDELRKLDIKVKE